MRKEIKITKKIVDDIYYFEEESIKGFLIPVNDYNDLIEVNFTNFIKLSDVVTSEEGTNFCKIAVNNEKAISIMQEELKNNPEAEFWELVIIIEEAFKKKSIDIKKFRGDLAEVIFLINNGGEKMYETETADIKVGNDICEVKSFSYSSKEINISNQQTKNEVLTYAVGIKFDSAEGLSLIEMIEKVEGNLEFKNYITKKYAGTVLGEKMKYSFDEENITEITEFIRNLNLNSFVVEAKVRLFF